MLLGQEEVDVQRGQVLKRGDRRAGGDVVADIHLTDADGAGEGRQDALLRQTGAQLRDAGRGLLRFGIEPVILAARNGLAIQQAARALEFQA